MVITGLNSNRSYSLQLTPRELSIIISTLDCTLTSIEDRGIIPESLVSAASRAKSDPADFERGVTDAKRMMLTLAATLPGWREL